MNQSVELVVFDIAGTTVKDKGEIAAAFQSALRAYGYDVPEDEINPLMGYKKTEAIQLLLNEYEKNHERITNQYIQKIHQHFLETMMEHYSTTDELEPMPDAEEVFGLLKKKKIQVALNTGFSKEITDIIVERLGWVKDKLVDHVLTSSEVVAGRPFPFMIEEIMHQANINDPKKVVKVGDTEVDVYEGKNAGCLYSIGVTTGAFTRQELEKYEPSFIIDDLRELIPIIDNIS